MSTLKAYERNSANASTQIGDGWEIPYLGGSTLGLPAGYSDTDAWREAIGDHHADAMADRIDERSIRRWFDEDQLNVFGSGQGVMRILVMLADSPEIAQDMLREACEKHYQSQERRNALSRETYARTRH
jgi:hypothetical protein